MSALAKSLFSVVAMAAFVSALLVWEFVSSAWATCHDGKSASDQTAGEL